VTIPSATTRFTWQRRNGPAHGQIATLDETGQAALNAATLEEDVPVAGPAAQPQVGTEPIHEPFVAPARMSPPETNHIAEAELDDFRLTRRHVRATR
jgi:hypothetical protein